MVQVIKVSIAFWVSSEWLWGMRVGLFKVGISEVLDENGRDLPDTVIETAS